ncbi:unnamed protein product [Schistosoma margrebowiei]|uniref:Uncharacterized protein n=1 Tax=Schistosoma margrebowiei TaxID=48269 RepID=A0A183LW43_9TREM|nr:unnamed protein product [Schistosoma margrebowiei]
MKTSTSEGKHGIQCTARNQSENLDLADDQALLLHIRTNADEDNYSSRSLCISKPQHTHRKKQDPQIQRGKYQPNHT